MNEQHELVKTEPRPIPMGKYGVQLSTLEDAFRFAKAVCLSGFAPKGIDRPESVLIAVQLGAEVGMTPMASLQSIAVINGRPAIYGDAALALVRASGELERYQQALSGDGDARKATVTVKRRGQGEIVSEFSVGDAKRAKLYGKPGPWSEYPDRMLLFRARGFALRDGFGDILKGLRTVEEAGDIIDVTPAAAAPLPPSARLARSVQPPAAEAGGEGAPAPADQAPPAPEAAAPARRRISDASVHGALHKIGLTLPEAMDYWRATGACPATAMTLAAVPSQAKAALVDDWAAFNEAYTSWIKEEEDPDPAVGQAAGAGVADEA